jgi:hypothetical protein
MAGFDFVTDEALRIALEADARELKSCLEAGSHKAVQVLAGSIVEALLADHLRGIDYKDAGGKDILEMDLGQLVAAAKSTNTITPRTADLASVVRSYRNLIHPGRVVRLNERVTPDTAAIANHLVQVVADEVAARKRSTYGYTAQQIVTKLEVDPSAMTILADLLRDTPTREQEVLLVDAIPKRYLEIAILEYIDDETVLTRLKRAYRFAIDTAPDAVRKRAAAKYVRVLKEEPEFEVKTYESVFFRASDLTYMEPEDALVAKKHFIARLEQEMTPTLSDALIGMGTAADADDVVAIVDAAIRFVLGHDDASKRQFARSIIDRLWREMPIGPDAAVTERLGDWERTFETRDDDPHKTWIAEIRASMEDIPF